MQIAAAKKDIAMLNKIFANFHDENSRLIKLNTIPNVKNNKNSIALFAFIFTFITIYFIS